MKNKQSLSFRLVDIFYLAMAVLPLAAGIALKVLTNVPSDEINITGAGIYFTINAPIQPFIVSESQVNSLLVIITVFFLCLYLTHGLTPRCDSKRQIIAEWIVEKTDGLVEENMGDYFKGFSPFIGAMMALSAFSSLICLLGLYSPTSDINIVGGWAILVFLLITYYKMKCGPIHYIKSFGEPVKFLAPLNIISEVATPLSMAFRHYGNILSGSVISVLVGYALTKVSAALFGKISFLENIPVLRVGLPAVLSIYFDVFSGLLQAFIFSMLTMLYVGGSFSYDDYMAKKEKKSKQKTKSTKPLNKA